MSATQVGIITPSNSRPPSLAAALVNLAFSYDFLPPFFHGANGEFVSRSPNTTKWTFSSARGSALLARPVPGLLGRYDDLAVGDVAEQVERNARVAVGALDSIAKKWADSESFLERFSPPMLAEDYRLRIERYQAEQENRPWAERPFPITQALGVGVGSRWLRPGVRLHNSRLAIRSAGDGGGLPRRGRLPSRAGQAAIPEAAMRPHGLAVRDAIGLKPSAYAAIRENRPWDKLRERRGTGTFLNFIADFARHGQRQYEQKFRDVGMPRVSLRKSDCRYPFGV